MIKTDPFSMGQYEGLMRVLKICIEILTIQYILSHRVYAEGAQFFDQKTENVNTLSNLTTLNFTTSCDGFPSEGKTIMNHTEKEVWNFDRIEYDLMDYLQKLETRFNESQLASQQPSQPVTNQYYEGKTASPEISTSLASGDQDIAESSWQYGIFDRFTRPKTSSTSTTQEPSLVTDPNRFDVRDFNSDECGLRTYEDQVKYFSQYQTEGTQTKHQIRRNRRPMIQASLKKHQPISGQIDDQDRAFDSASDGNNESSDDSVENTNSKPANGAESSTPLEDWFQLSSRRQWLQQQLGHTLQLLGFNSTSQAPGEFLNQTLGVSSNLHENLKKKMGKSAKLHSDANKETDLNQDKDGNNQQDPIRKVNANGDLKLEPRVIGGNDARFGDSPWSVSLQALVSRPGTGAVEYRHYCGGTIISEHYILTAAHCLDFMVGRESRLFVVIGDLNWRLSGSSLYGRRLAIDKLIIHSGYKSTAFGHDIGLIRTKESIRPLKVNGRYVINSVCLPEVGVEHTGEAELVGWGLFSNRNEMADSLQIAEVPILPRPLCVDLYRRRTGLIQWLIGIELITDKQICAGTFGRGICQGDSGSALVINERLSMMAAASRLKKRTRRSYERDGPQSRATIIGVVAFGGIRRCSYQSLPGVYMQTSKYIDWILSRI